MRNPTVLNPQINLTLANASGAKICLQPLPSCDTPAELCAPGSGICTYAIVKSGKCDCCPVGPSASPPPLTPGSLYPPPQKPSPFPFCKCNKTAGVTPFSLAPNVVVSNGTIGPIYTWTVISNPPIDPNGPCASTNLLFKAEFWSNLNCYRAVRRAFINNQAVSPSWDPVNAVWKVTNINIAASEISAISATGQKTKVYTSKSTVGTIGFELDPYGPCPTLNSLCHNSNGNCDYRLFDTSKKCCPGGSIPI